MSNNKTIAQKMNEEKDGIPIKCEYCGYFWVYGGKMKMATCPSCSNKNDINENKREKK